MSELAPGWTNAHMTKSQVRKYVKDMKNAQKSAQKKLEEAKASWVFKKDAEELKQIEKELDNL